MLVVPTCPPPGDCGEGVAHQDRFYALSCWGVVSDAVGEAVVATGDTVFREARAITGLPPEFWLAVRGDLPCRPADGAPLAHTWYLIAFGDVPSEVQQEHGARISSVVIAP